MAIAKNLTITTPRTSCIYFLPKIHKPNNPGRPIVSACSCPTERIFSYLEKIMAPIVKTLLSYIKDSQHALEIFRDFSFLGQNKLIFTMNITTLWTVIPNDEGLRALKHFFHHSTVKDFNLALKHYTVWPNQYSHLIAFHSVVTITNKLITLPWVLKWDPATPIFS